MKRTIYFLFVILTLCGIVSCSKKAPTIEYMSGIVKDMDGNPIVDVEVESNSYTTKTNEQGSFTLEHIQNTNGRYVMNFHKKGYFPVVRSGSVSSVGLIEVVLIKENLENVSKTTTFTAANGAKVSVGNLAVDIPKNGIAYEDGTPYKGKVNVSVLYLDPTKPTFQSSMPGGDLIAQRSETNEEVPLVSYGMVNVVMKDTKGAKLQINEESKSKVTFPIPEGMAEKAPAQMPLWHFNEATGIWEECGMATKNGDVYEGEVAHFSWVNLDDPKEFVVLKGKVKDDKGNALAGVKVIIEQVYAYTNEDGEYSVRIPSETDVTVKIRKEDYLNYDNEFSILIKGQPGNTTYTQDIVLPSFPSIKGKLENSCDKNVSFPIYCQYERNGEKETTTFTLPQANGQFAVKIPSDAQNVSVHVVIPGGEEVTQEISFTGEDFQIIGSIIVCRQDIASREEPRITIGNEVIPLKANEFDYSGVGKDGAEIGNDDIEIKIDKYVEDSVFLNGHVTIEKYHFESTSARIEKRKIDNHVSISIVATGKAKKDENSAESDALFEGTYTVPYLYGGKCNDFSKLCWDPAIPTMRTPYWASQGLILDMPISILAYEKATTADFSNLTKITDDVDPFSMYIGYLKADDETYQKLISYLTENGFESSKDNAYCKGDIYIKVHYGKDKTIKIGESPDTFKMEVTVNTGLMKWFKNLIKRLFGFDWFS